MEILLRTALGAFFTALVSAAFAISFAAIIYTGDLAQYLEQGIALTLLGATIISVIGAYTLSFRGSILGPQDVPAILISTSAASIIASAQLPPETVFPTIASLIAVCAVVSGVTSVLVGKLRLAHIARFFPYPVLAGFLATTGLLLLMAGLDIALGNLMLPDWTAYGSADAVLRWGAVVVVAILMVVGTRLFQGFLVMPFALIAALMGFYALYWVLGFSMGDLRDSGLLLGPFKDGGFVAALDPTLPARADWGVILGQAPLILTVSAATLIGATLNASGLELQLEQDFDINREIKSTGFGNIVSGLMGGIPGYHVVGETILANRLGLAGATAGLSAGAGCAFLLFAGASLLTALPVGFFAAVIAFLGVDLLYTWFWEERRQFGWSDYVIVALIPLIAVLFGFLTAIAVGLLMACGLFVLAYAQLDIVKFKSDVSTRRSRVERPDAQAGILKAEGHTAQIIELSGFLFFGSSSGLRTRLQDVMGDAPDATWLILDFSNVTGVDISTRHTLKRIASDCAARDVGLVLTGLDAGAFDALTGASGLVGVYPTLDEGIEHIEEALIGRAGADTMPEASVFDDVMALFSDDRLAQYTQTLSLTAGETVISQTASSKDIYLVKSGRLRVTATTAAGQEVVVAHVRPGAVIGEMANYVGGARTAKITAAEPTSLFCIKMADFDRLEAEHPDVAAPFHRLMAQVMARRLERTTRLLRDLGV